MIAFLFTDNGAPTSHVPAPVPTASIATSTAKQEHIESTIFCTELPVSSRRTSARPIAIRDLFAKWKQPSVKQAITAKVFVQDCTIIQSACIA